MKELILRSKKLAYGELLGRYAFKLRGEGIDFRGLREYNFEDARKIDWRASAKFNKLYMKEFEDERELNIVLAILISGSLYFGTSKLKSYLAAEIISTLSFLALKFENRLRVAFVDKNIEFLAIKREKDIKIVVDKVLGYEYLGKDYNLNLEVFNRLKKSMLFLIGDFYKIPSFPLKHELYGIVLRDRVEENRNFSMPVVDPITLKRYPSLSKRRVKKFIKEIDDKIANFPFPWVKIYTDDSIELKLWELLK